MSLQNYGMIATTSIRLLYKGFFSWKTCNVHMLFKKQSLEKPNQNRGDKKTRTSEEILACKSTASVNSKHCPTLR
jgi:hypothetical protein